MPLYQLFKTKDIKEKIKTFFTGFLEIYGSDSLLIITELCSKSELNKIIGRNISGKESKMRYYSTPLDNDTEYLIIYGNLSSTEEKEIATIRTDSTKGELPTFMLNVDMKRNKLAYITLEDKWGSILNCLTFETMEKALDILGFEDIEKIISDLKLQYSSMQGKE